MSVYSGSTYVGETRDGWHHGKGEYTYPSGVKYKGNFHKGQFHGEGTLIYQNGGYFKGVWNLGKKVSGDYFFFDDLKFEDENWDYCIGDDRRFNYERNNGIKPAGQTQITNDPNGENSIPPGTYDTGDGYFDPIRTLVYSYDGKKLLRTPEDEEVDWITRTCRYEPRSTEKPLTGDEDEIIKRVMELQNEGRREIAEELMKGGVREPDRYLIKKEPEPVLEPVVTEIAKEPVKEEATPAVEEKKVDTPKKEPTVEEAKDDLEKAIEESETQQKEEEGSTPVNEEFTTENTEEISSQIGTQQVAEDKPVETPKLIVDVEEPKQMVAEEESLDTENSDDE